MQFSAVNNTALNVSLADEGSSIFANLVRNLEANLGSIELLKCNRLSRKWSSDIERVWKALHFEVDIMAGVNNGYDRCAHGPT